MAQESNHTYKTVGDVSLDIQVFTPDADSPHASRTDRPAIVFFFGGGWRGGSTGQFKPHAKALADLGMVAATAEYRVLTRHGTSPIEAILDGKSAMGWMRQHAADFGVDPNRIAAGGGSAGGHVAACTAFTVHIKPEEGDALDHTPNALALFNPVLDVTAPSRWAERFNGRDRDGSPLQGVCYNAPPAIVFHGDADTTVPILQAREFRDAMHRMDNTCELHEYPGEEHAFFNYTRNKAIYEDTMVKLIAFLEKLGWLQPTKA